MQPGNQLLLVTTWLVVPVLSTSYFTLSCLLAIYCKKYRVIPGVFVDIITNETASFVKFFLISCKNKSDSASMEARAGKKENAILVILCMLPFNVLFLRTDFIVMQTNFGQ